MGGCNNPKTVFAPVLKNMQPRDKIATGSFRGHPFPSLWQKNFEPTTFPRGRVSFQSLEGGWCDPVILKLDDFENM